MAETENNLQPALSKERPAIIRWPMRLAAYAIDWVAIFFVAYSLELFARPQLMALGPLLPFLSTFGVFCYFWLGNGPMGGGGTLGKSILNLHVVDAEGKMIGYGPAFKRALLQFPAILTATFVLFREGLGLPSAFGMGIGQLFTTFSVAMLFTHAFNLGTHPLRRSWHELWSGSYVTSDPTPYTFAATIGSEKDEEFRTRFTSQRRTSIAFFSIVMLLILSQWSIQWIKPALRTETVLMDKIEAAAPIEKYRIAGVIVPTRADEETFLKNVALTLAHPPKEADALTTETLRGYVFRDGRTIIARYVKAYGETTRDELTSEKIRADIEALRNFLATDFSGRTEATPADPPKPNRLVVVFGDPFRFAWFPPYLPGKTLNTWFAMGPLDGPREKFQYEWMEQKAAPPTAKHETK